MVPARCGLPLFPSPCARLLSASRPSREIEEFEQCPNYGGPVAIGEATHRLLPAPRPGTAHDLRVILLKPTRHSRWRTWLRLTTPRPHVVPWSGSGRRTGTAPPFRLLIPHQRPPQPRAEPPAFTRVLPLQLLTAMAESSTARASHSAGRWLRHTATRLPQRRMRSPTRWPGATAASYCGRQRGRPSDLASVPSVSCRSWNWDPMTLASPSTVSPNPSSYFFLDPFSIFVQGPLDF